MTAQIALQVKGRDVIINASNSYRDISHETTKRREEELFRSRPKRSTKAWGLILPPEIRQICDFAEVSQSKHICNLSSKDGENYKKKKTYIFWT